MHCLRIVWHCVRDKDRVCCADLDCSSETFSILHMCQSLHLALHSLFPLVSSASSLRSSASLPTLCSCGPETRVLLSSPQTPACQRYLSSMMSWMWTRVTRKEKEGERKQGVGQ